VIARGQLLDLGYSVKAIEHRIAKGRLHRVWPGVFAVGRPALIQKGRWMAAVLSCGTGAYLSHESAAALWSIRPLTRGQIDVSVPSHLRPRRRGIDVHRRKMLAPGVTKHHAIPVTTPTSTLIDLATKLDRSRLEAAVNEADKLGLVDPERLRSALDASQPRPGTRVLRVMLDEATFVLTDSELERLFLPIARRAGLSLPNTGCLVNGFKVDFFWPHLGLVVETDGLRYHRTAVQQSRDRRRDQTHIANGLTVLRFTHAQVKFDAGDVEATLVEVAQRLLAVVPAAR
jgi:hypothetical protein